MMKQTNLSDALGRTLTDFDHSKDGKEVVMVFGDEYVCLTIQRAHETCDDEIVEVDVDIDFGRDKLLRLGIMTAFEVCLKINEKRLKQEMIERAEYERLKAKFENDN